MDDHKNAAPDIIIPNHIEGSQYKKKRMDRESELNKKRSHQGSVSSTLPKATRSESDFVPRENNSRTPSIYQNLHPQSLLTQ